jgi:aspartokinase-like uncharacterized kinase
MSKLPWIVVKLGGSVLAQPHAITRFVEWLHTPDASAGVASRLVIVGGGLVVEGLRAIDAANGLASEACHWTAIDAMNVNARLVAGATGLRLTERLPRPEERADRVLAPGRVLRVEEPAWEGARLPVSWEVTSDSIAARIAGRIGAALVLIKSCAPPASAADGDWRLAASEGFVDSFFPRVATTPVRAATLPWGRQ